LLKFWTERFAEQQQLILIALCRSSGSLRQDRLPVLGRQWHKSDLALFEAYSSCFCSGFAPDSLLIPCNKQEGTKRRKGKKNDCVFRLQQTREEKIIQKHLTNHF
jgi:hypothetical protein